MEILRTTLLLEAKAMTPLMVDWARISLYFQMFLQIMNLTLQKMGARFFIILEERKQTV